MIRRYIVLILLVSWAMVIFFFSSQTYEEQSITPFLAQFNTPYWYDKLSGISFMYGGVEVSAQTVGVNGFLEFFLRKGAHLFIFFVFGLLTYRVWGRFVKNPVLSFSGALFCVLLYASADELHQKLTGGRTPLWQDVMLDTFGGLLGIFFSFFLYRWRMRQ
ncbi:VanZ family protein [Peribacillus frigoritolerans]|uniref:VanZ family protein n=1 Tax=Peribacillus frigoritolerans TaxID=450367 RepID=UPI0025A037DA|nr:VanZ family protein [Peribacillus frigoritolerans]MDM5307506.1 VanZ family protein [Peribacillus frigoritolerans]